MARVSERRQQADKTEARTRRRLDEPVLSVLPDFALVVCERCGLEQANRDGGCFLCGHRYATSSPHHAAALASLRLFRDGEPA